MPDEAIFRGFGGYVQADAKSVFDVLLSRPRKPPDDTDDGKVRVEVGCWCHGRHKFWEAALAKSVVARGGLLRIARFFDLESAWRGKPAAEILALRQELLRPEMEAFFAWAEVEYERGFLRSALGYAIRQKAALLRPLEDGRLILENNRSERALRRIAVGRKNWLFAGSDGLAEAVGHLFSLITSACLHRLDPEGYLRDLFRVLAHWPKDR